MSLEKIGIVGAGQMGGGIAHVAALAGRRVTLLDVSEDLVKRGLKTIEKNLGRQVEKGKVSAEARDAALSRIVPATDVAAFADADLVVEAVVENEGAKKELFGRLDAAVKADGIFASNTSSISITRLAAATKRPERFIGMHL